MRLAVLLTASLLAVGGCLDADEDPHGDGDHPHGDGHHDGRDVSDDGTLPITGEEDVTIEVTGGRPSEFRFDPERIEVEAGQRVGIVFHNEGDAEHEFSIGDLEFHLHDGSGGTERGAFLAPEPGEYVIGCYVPGHFESGMKGTLVVV